MNTLKLALAKLGMTQKDLSRLSGISEISISAIVNGKTDPRPETRQKIEQVLKSEINWDQTYDQGRINYQHQPQKRTSNNN